MVDVTRLERLLTAINCQAKSIWKNIERIGKPSYGPDTNGLGMTIGRAAGRRKGGMVVCWLINYAEQSNTY
jgi:hypothetical protein